MYDQREKAQRDYEWALAGAREEGMEKGREEGQLIGKLVLLKELLGEPEVDSSLLAKLDQKEMARQVSELQARLRRRDA